MNSCVIIPARLASMRLPNKPLADIRGVPMIVRVLRQAEKADIGPVIVAAGDQEIVDVVEAHGGQAVMTDPKLPSGSDRVWQVAKDMDCEYVINLQGDLPLISPDALQKLQKSMVQSQTDITTLAVKIVDDMEKLNPNVVKVAADLDNAPLTRAVYFSRQPTPWGSGCHWHHVGIYGYKKSALETFVALPPSGLEKRERLEQLRALEAGMTIMVQAIDTMPMGVDTPEDLENIRKMAND